MIFSQRVITFISALRKIYFFADARTKWLFVCSVALLILASLSEGTAVLVAFTQIDNLTNESRLGFMSFALVGSIVFREASLSVGNKGSDRHSGSILENRFTVQEHELAFNKSWILGTYKHNLKYFLETELQSVHSTIWPHLLLCASALLTMFCYLCIVFYIAPTSFVTSHAPLGTLVIVLSSILAAILIYNLHLRTKRLSRLQLEYIRTLNQAIECYETYYDSLYAASRVQWINQMVAIKDSQNRLLNNTRVVLTDLPRNILSTLTLLACLVFSINSQINPMTGGASEVRTASSTLFVLLVLRSSALLSSSLVSATYILNISPYLRSLSSHLTSYDDKPSQEYAYKSRISSDIISYASNDMRGYEHSPKTYFIEGESGSGKTTELKRIVQHLKFQRPKLNTCYLPQNILFKKDLDVSMFLVDPSSLLAPSLQTIKTLNDFKLEDLRVSFLETQNTQLYRTLSGGESQRLLFLLQYLNDPDIWILDEPTASQDSAMTMRLLSLLRETSATTIIVSHDPIVKAFLDEEKSYSLTKIRLKNRA